MDNNGGWQTGAYRVFCAYWTATALSWGLDAERTAVLADYFSLIGNCLATIAVAQGDSVVFDADDDGVAAGV